MGQGGTAAKGCAIEARLAMEAGRLRQSIDDIERHAGINIPEEPRLVLADGIKPQDDVPYIMEKIRGISKKYDALGFLVDGFEVGEEGDRHVLSFRIKPGAELEEFRGELCRIANITGTRDKNPGLRATITDGLDGAGAAAARIATGIEPGGRPVRRITFPSEVLLLTMTYRGRIIAEYDRTTGRILGRRQALSGAARHEMLAAYRRMRGIEVPPGRRMPGRTWVTSDTHFDHANIIKYTGRPFSDAGQMNKIIASNWNNTISPGDRVYFLGDMAFGRGSRPKEHWLGRLNGRITYVRGNHDRGEGMVDSAEVLHGGTRYLLVHDPRDAPEGWDGWIIHGDKHNNQLAKYPLVNTRKRTINACCELTRFAPISMDVVAGLVRDGVDRMVL